MHILPIASATENIPSPPQNVGALLSHGYIKVTWDSPAENSDKVTFYNVNYRRAEVGPTRQVKIVSTFLQATTSTPL